MNDQIEAKIRQRANEMWEGESHPTAEQHWLAAEREVTEEAQNAAISRWAAPVSGAYVEKTNAAARIAGKAREAGAAARGNAEEIIAFEASVWQLMTGRPQLTSAAP
jgi:Protein of unknown function (DUF2934)